MKENQPKDTGSQKEEPIIRMLLNNAEDIVRGLLVRMKEKGESNFSEDAVNREIGIAQRLVDYVNHIRQNKDTNGDIN